MNKTRDPWCKYGHYEEWAGLPECVNESAPLPELEEEEETPLMDDFSYLFDY